MSQSLQKALDHSRYLQRLFNRHPALAETVASSLEHPLDTQFMQDFLASLRAASNDAECKHNLRRLRQMVMAQIICRDLLGLAHFTEIAAAVSDLAEVAIQAALAYISTDSERFGQPIGQESGQVQQLLVVGMGKLGGRELNVSSDIDLIFVYPEDGTTNGSTSIDIHDFFTRIGRRLIGLLADITEDGFVFRVDMRLRPFGESGPLVTSFAALENYLLTQGREWERYAWIKGRPLTGDGEGLLALVTPFVYRKYLDYGAFQSMRDLHAQIRREVARKDKIDNIKLGPGGIREVEFICQVFQLIRGGRHKALRTRATLEMLTELENWGILPAEAVEDLRQAYLFLRNLEHRIMYLDDAQTQKLPTSAEDQMRIATSMGFASWDTFLPALDSHRQRVSQLFEQIFESPEEEAAAPEACCHWQDSDVVALEAALTKLGYSHASETRNRLAALQGGSRYQHLPERCRHHFEQLLPKAIEAAAATHNPDTTLARMLALLEAISGREAYLALIKEHHEALARLASLYSASDWVSAYLTQHPILLDDLLDTHQLYQPLDWTTLGERLRSDMAEQAGDTEARMDTLRHFQHQQIFRLVAQDLSGQMPLTTLSDHLSALADLILTVTMEECWHDLAGKHQETPRFAIIAYGKLGGKELGYASDLDLVFLYEDAHPDAGEIYAKLTRRMVNWLTTLTAAGQLYEIDLRLRPNGASGFLVSSVEAFAQYQHESAWVWEHQALTRARFIAGDAAIGATFEALRIQLLQMPRDLATLRQEVIAMRTRIAATHPPRAHDVKYCPGGLVDVEFLVQFLILAYAGQHPELTANKGNIALLGMAAAAGLIDPQQAAHAQTAYRECRRLQHRSRLNDSPVTDAEVSELATELETVVKLGNFLLKGGDTE